VVRKLEVPRGTDWTEERIREASLGLESSTPQEIVQWADKEFFPDLTLACSFGGVSGMALLDMTMKVNAKVPVFYIDTDLLFPETYALRDEASERYGVAPIGYRTDVTLEEQAERHGEALWSTDPDLCCEIRKVEPNRRALAGKRAWIAGLRRDQGTTRKDVGIVEWDAQSELIKVNPLANWTEAQVWGHILTNRVPYNRLHDQGYPSIGCTHCTRAVKPGEDPRAGRWAGFDKTECGIHVGPDGTIGRGSE
jgi:phosphoadenosine phosphosulfate reductase